MIIRSNCEKKIICRVRGSDYPRLYANAPASAIAHMANGVNIIYCAPENDLVVVVRWIENNKINEFLGKLLASLKN